MLKSFNFRKLCLAIFYSVNDNKKMLFYRLIVDLNLDFNNIFYVIYFLNNMHIHSININIIELKKKHIP